MKMDFNTGGTWRRTAGLNVDLGSFFELAELMVGMS